MNFLCYLLKVIIYENVIGWGNAVNETSKQHCPGELVIVIL
jgi:hypothetical protein